MDLQSDREGGARRRVPPSMLVPVMHVRIVGVRVFERLVDVPMGVWLFAISPASVLMLMVLIMDVRVFVLQARMPMLVVLGQMQPHPRAHE